jgi:septum formation protein
MTFPMRLILASGSRGRRWLMEQAGYSFEVRPANIDEPVEAEHGDIREYVQRVAWMKAAKVAPAVSDGVVIAADSVGWHRGRVVGKPADVAEAERILRDLAGTVHQLWTGVTLWVRPGDWQICWQEVSDVAVKAFDQSELDAYLASNKWVGCSGAYAVEGADDPWVRVVSGSLSNVVGLPMESLVKNLERIRHG